VIELSPLEEAMASVGDATVPDDVVALELPDRLRPDGSEAELRHLILVGLFDLLAEASLGVLPSDAEREALLMGEGWLIPRLEADVAAYRARIDSLRRALEAAPR